MVTITELVTCGSCTKKVRIFRSEHKKHGNYLQCPECGKNLFVDGYGIKPLDMEENMKLVNEMREERSIEAEGELEDDTINDMLAELKRIREM